MPRTSLSHPLQIDAVTVPKTGAKIGMTLCPGMKENAARERAWDRDLDRDLAEIKAWGASALVSLLEGYEFEVLGVSEFPGKIKASGLEWYHLPIMNRDIPCEDFEKLWVTNGPQLRRRLRQGERIVLHCKNGLGRTGMIAARLLVELGEYAEAAIRRVRSARPGAIETLQQKQNVYQFRPLVGEE